MPLFSILNHPCFFNYWFLVISLMTEFSIFLRTPNAVFHCRANNVRGQHRSNNEFIFILIFKHRDWGYFSLFGMSRKSPNTAAKETRGHSVCLLLSELSQNWIGETAYRLRNNRKVVIVDPHFLGNFAKFGYFTLSVCTERERNE